MRKLGHDILDKQILDRAGRKIAKVDSIIITYGGSGAPRVAAIETGFVVLGRRLGPRAARLAERLMKWLGVREGRPWRMEASRVVKIGRHIETDVDAVHSSVSESERLVRDRIIKHIPGA